MRPKLIEIDYLNIYLFAIHMRYFNQQIISLSTLHSYLYGEKELIFIYIRVVSFFLSGLIMKKLVGFGKFFDGLLNWDHYLEKLIHWR